MVMSEGIKNLNPRGPYGHLLKKEGTEFNLGLLPLVVGYGPKGPYRFGSGGKASIPMTNELNLGGSYINNYLPTSKTFRGHHFELGIELTEKLLWGTWRFGLFSELASLSSWRKIKENGGIGGIFVGADMPIVNLSRRIDLKLCVEAGLGPEFDDFDLGNILIGALELNLRL